MQRNGTDCGVHVIHNMSIIADKVRLTLYNYQVVYCDCCIMHVHKCFGHRYMNISVCLLMYAWHGLYMRITLYSYMY